MTNTVTDATSKSAAVLLSTQRDRQTDRQTDREQYSRRCTSTTDCPACRDSCTVSLEPSLSTVRHQNTSYACEVEGLDATSTPFATQHNQHNILSLLTRVSQCHVTADTVTLSQCHITADNVTLSQCHIQWCSGSPHLIIS